MKPGNYESYWKKLFNRNQECLPDLLADDPYEHWSSHPRAHGLAETLFGDAFWVSLARHKGPEARTFAEKAVEVCERAFAEGTLSKGLNRHEYPLNEGLAYRCHAYATFLSGSPLPSESLAKSAECIVRWFSPGSGENPVGETQAYVISALSSALISRSLPPVDRIRALVPRLSKWKKYSGLLLALCDLASPGSDRKADTVRILPDFDKLFDVVRRPAFADPLLSFELAYLRAWMTSKPSSAPTLSQLIDLLLY